MMRAKFTRKQSRLGPSAKTPRLNVPIPPRLLIHFPTPKPNHVQHDQQGQQHDGRNQRKCPVIGQSLMA